MTNERILVVDDDKEICRFMEKTLNSEGYKTESVHSAKDAIRLVKETHFNLVMLDNKLPDVEGIDLLTQLSEIDSDLDTIIITAFASLETAIRAIDNGAASYIVKPLDLREILPKVAGVLEKQRLVKEKKMIERALVESDDKYRSLFENLPVGLAYHRIIINNKGQPEDYEFLDVNEQFEALTGLDRTDILGKSASEVLAVLGKQEWIERFNTVAQTGVRTSFDQYSEIMGRWFSVTAYCPEDEFLVAAFTDITERKRSEKEIRDSEERFRSLFENAQVGIFRTSINDGTVIECNEIGARILGYNNPDEVKAEYVASEHYVDPTSRPKMLDLLAKEGKFENFQAQLTKRDGSPIWLEYSARLFTKEGYLETVIQDISERKQTQEDLERAVKKYRNLVEESMQGVAVYQDERFVYANPAFATTLGYTVEELIQLSPEDVRRLIHHEDRETILKRFGSIEAGLHFLPRTIFRYLNKTGAIRWVESYTRKTEHDGKNAIQIVAIDITERRLAEDRMRTAAETANLYVDLMSHDIRNHLQAIVMATDILAHYETLPEVDQTHQLIVDSVKKSQTLIRKITATRDLFTVPLEETSLKEILDESLHRFRESFPDVEINVEYAIDKSTIMADHFLENMLLNLLENAVLHNESHVKRLWIVLKETNEGFEVSISDNGPGIDELKKEVLFDPGRRFGGVGLHQSLRIAEKYLGKISVHDRVSDPDQGAEFRVWIPKLLSST